MTGSTSTVVGGLSFPESPRWRDGRLYISDMGTRKVVSIDIATGEVATRCDRVPGAPSGLTWDDQGRMLVVSMARAAVYRDDGGEQLTELASLSEFGGGWRNDAVRHPAGWLYVGAVGNPADLVMVDAAGKARVVVAGMASPNGMAITADGATLIVAEYEAHRLTAFTIGEWGELGSRRTWAELPGSTPDGICLDADGAVWVAWADHPEVRRVAEGGDVLETVVASQPAYACALGGADRRTLLLCTAPGPSDEGRAAMGGRIEAVGVSTPGAGYP
ncbi:MAG: SMP-30/gluconolactonase/LRE family protein [Acidobacteria bacterium]|nr:SMP-30/gluconolactonase/LRE family protein [Acidobacteriota bacterium]